MLRRLYKRIAAWRRSAPSRPPASPAEAIAEATSSSSITDFEARLAGLSGDDAAFLSGELHHLGLDEVRDALGDSWEALAPQLVSFAATRLELWTGLRDEVRRTGEAGFAIRFADLPPPVAEQQVRRLALRLKSELLEAFPQVTNGRDAAPMNTAAAHEVMARRLEVSQQFRRAMQNHDGSDPRLWRSALGQAVLDLLEADSELSAETLIAQLQSHEADHLVLQAASIDAAIERLRAVAARARREPEAAAAASSTGGAG